MPSTVAPSLKVTVPVGEAPVTVAVNVTACPAWLGLSDEVSAVVVPATLTPWVNIGDELASLLLSPPYSAVIECEPVVSDAVVSVATPPLSATVPSTVAPSLKVTAPVGVPEEPVTVAVKIDRLAELARVLR